MWNISEMHFHMSVIGRQTDRQNGHTANHFRLEDDENDDRQTINKKGSHIQKVDTKKNVIRFQNVNEQIKYNKILHCCV